MKLYVNNIILSIFFIFMSVLGLAGCISKKNDSLILSDDMKVIYGENIFLNKKYVEEQEYVINYTIKNYQNKDSSSLVELMFNSEFFESL